MFLSQVELKKVNQALDDVSWVEAMQDELLQFKLLNVWTMVDLLKGKKAIGTKWVFKNKKDQRGIVVRNKARLVAQGHRQEEGIDYDEVFAPVARIEAIRLFLAYASYMDFTVYQIDVKSAFIYSTIEEEVYVNQALGFEDPEFPNKVYKVEKALYDLHQAPRAWYETLSTYLLENRFSRGTIDKTLFIKKIKNDILLVQVYVDDIIFGSTKRSLSTEFEKLMHKRFQMSSMGELTFFLGLQVEQRKYGIFLSQDKYVYDILKKFGFTTVKTASTPMETHKSLSSNAAEPDVDVHLYRSMIDTLMYLTSSRPDIMFAGKPTLGLWYPKDSPIDLIAYSDSDYAGASIDRKSTTREEGLQVISATIDGHEKLITEASLRRHLKLEDAEDISSLSNEEIFEQLAHMGFIQLLLNKQQRLLLPHTRTYPTPTLTSKLFSNMRRASKGYSGVVTPLVESMLVQAHDEEQQQSPSKITSSPSLSPQPTQPSLSPEPIQLTHEAEETASMPHDSLLRAIHSHGSAEGSMQQHNLTVLVNKLNNRIDGLEKDLQHTKKTYSTALTKLVLRVNKLEHKLKSGKARRKAKIVLSDDEEIADDSSKQGRKISQIDEDPTISLVQDEEETPTEIIEEHESGEKGEMKISIASPPKVTKVSTAEAHVYTRSAKDKGKAIMEEPATPKKVKKRTQVQLSMDEELARKMEEEERARFNAEQEARALQEEEEERLNLEAAWELQRQLDERQQVPTEATQSKGIDWNDPSVLRYHALKNKPVSIAQARRNMITYLKNQGGYKESYFKRMSYNDIRPIFERVWDHVNTFIPIGSEVEKGSSKPSKRETSKTVEEEKVEKEDVKPDPVMIEKKAVGTRRKTLARRRASDKQVEDSSKRQKKEKESDDFEQEKEDLRMWLSVLKDEEESVTPEFLSVRYPIVNWEYQLHGRMEMKDMEAYKLTRADGTVSFHGGVHSVFLTDTPMEINMLVEKKYPLKKEILEKMINLKLQAEEESTMAFELIKFTRSQIEEKQ
ncbi:putative ribonuclease H-like domain-containing protein [Tanacetum coccineum]